MVGKSALIESIGNSLSDALGKAIKPQWLQDLPGGDINRAALIGDKNTRWFLKYKQDAPEGMFAAESLALEEIVLQGCIRAPSPIAYGSAANTAWLVLEHLALVRSGPSGLLGEQLAALHSTQFKNFGWRRNNFIGTTVQNNTSNSNWRLFWRDNRLKPQLALAEAAGFGAQLTEKISLLLEYLPQLMDGHTPSASLLHGDLWAGNKAFTPAGQPVIFDPASYYGDRETDIAMTELFGGFDSEFYAAYNANTPLPTGYQLRRELYNLYHMLNHLNLFGAAYLSRCVKMIDHLLAQVR